MGFGSNDSTVALIFSIKGDASQLKADFASAGSTIKTEVAKIIGEFASAQGGASGLTASFKNIVTSAYSMGQSILTATTSLVSFISNSLEASAALWDAHEKTGFLVESLSALKNLGETAGVSFQSISTALGLFEKNMGAAHNATSKQSALFKSLNIDVDDHEKALRQAFVALFNMKEGEEQTSAAMQLFGRSGKEMVGVIKESNGNLDTAMAKFKELGTLISTEDAKAADQMTDALKATGQELLSVARDLSITLIPVFKVLLGIINAVIVAVKALVATLKFLFSDGWLMDKLKELQDKQDRESFRMPGIAKMPALPGVQHVMDETPERTDIQGGAEEGNKTSMDTLHKMMQEAAKAASEAKRLESERLQNAKEASSARLEVLQIGERAATRIRQEQLEDAERAYKAGEVSRQEYSKRINAIEDAFLQTRKENIQKERDELEAQYDNAEQIKVKGLALDEQIKLAQIEHDKNLKTYLAKADLEEEARQKKHLEAVLEQEKISGDARIEQLKDEAERHKITYKAAEDAIIAIQARSLEKQGAAALEARNKEKAGTAEYERLNDIYLALQAKAAAFKEEVERRKREALKQTLALETAITTKAQMEARGGGGAQPSVGGETIDVFTQTHTHGADVTPKTTGEKRGLTENMDAFQAWGDKINEIFGLTGENAKVFGQIISQTFGQVAQAVGDAVKAFVLFGSTGGSLRKFAAEMIASIAAMSAVQAVYELAQGLAWTALNYFFPNPKYAEAAAAAFASAAVFGSIAGVSVIAGRALAGNAFANDQKQGAAVGSATGGTSRTSGTSGGQSDPRVIEVGRRLAASSSEDSSAHLAQAASDFRAAAADHVKAATIMNAAANRIYGQTASDVVRAGAPGAYREIATALGNAFEQSHPIRSQILYGTPRGIS
jgi:hypothetical protein